MDKNTQRVRFGCYFSNISMSIVGNLSPLLFLTFRETYGLSYSLLGLLVLINFCTQLIVDLIFSFFSHKFDIPKVVKFMPILTIVGLLIYALVPYFFPVHAYMGIAFGTVIFSAASGLGEVLISPVIAALPSDPPEREMSKLHSIYAWGVVGVVVVTTAYLLLFKSQNWYWLALLFILIPILNCCCFWGAELPKMQTPEKTSGAVSFLKRKEVWVCVIAIFFGGASEVTMAQWASGYLEQALHIPKIWGDICGVALFSVTLGIGRTLYAKIGKNIEKVLLCCAIGATACYLIAVLSPWAAVGLIACALTGLCTSMLWPGSLIVSSERVADGGVFMYAMMAAGGDMGASIGPQLVGVVTDAVSAAPSALTFAESLGLTVEQLAMKAGMAVGTLFPLAAIFVFLYILKTKPNKENSLLHESL